MLEVEEWLAQNYAGRPIAVDGYLIGRVPLADTKSPACRDLLRKRDKRGPTEAWEIMTLREMLAHALRIHKEAIDALEKAEDEHIDGTAKKAALPPPRAVKRA